MPPMGMLEGIFVGRRWTVLAVVAVPALLASLVYSAFVGEAASVLLVLIGLTMLQQDAEGWEVYLVGAVVLFLLASIA